MVSTDLKIAFRILKKHRLSSVITIAGLGLGLAVFALFAAFVRDELSFDRFHARADRLYLLTNEFNGRFFSSSHHFIAEILESGYTEVRPGAAVRYAAARLPVRRGPDLASKDFAFCDQGFFDLFDFRLVVGDPARVLAGPQNVVLTSGTAESLGLGPNPLGQTLTVRLGEEDRDFIVAGIVRNVPENSSLRFDAILPFQHAFEAYQIDPSNNDFVTLPMFSTTFLELADEAAAASLLKKLPALGERLYGEMWKKVKMDPPKQGLGLLKLANYHLGDVQSFSLAPRSRPSYSLTLSGIAILILLLACFNSVNLSLARNTARLKEIGVRKVIGAGKSHLVGQFLAESFLSGIGALFIGFLGAAILASSLNRLTGKALDLRGLFHPHILAVMTLAVLAVVLATGWIPARALFRHSAAAQLKGRLGRQGKNKLPSLFLVVQFAVSLVLLTGTLVMTRQLAYAANADLGYDASGLIVIDTQTSPESRTQGESLLEIFQNALRSDPRILAVAGDSGTVGSGGDGGITRRFDKDGVEHVVEGFQVDPAYVRALDIPLLSGSGFSAERPAEARDGVLVNEALVRDFGLENPVGMKFSQFARDKFPPEYTLDPVIIGVVKDFHLSSLHDPIRPMALGLRTFFPRIQRIRNILVKTRPREMSVVSETLARIWAEVRPGVPFRGEFLDEFLARQYRRDRNWSRIVGWAGGFALFISCLGLLGITAIAVVRRTKEIGIRKVMGARGGDVLSLFLKENLRWIAVAAVLACPIAYAGSRRWLESFAYRVDLTVWTFAGAVLLAMVAAGLTVSGQVLRALRADPVRNLRYE